jgi:hypothetical protein
MSNMGSSSAYIIGISQTASLEPVVEAAVDVGVRALPGTAVKSMKPPGYSVSLTRPGVFVTFSRMLVDLLFKLIRSLLLFARVL